MNGQLDQLHEQAAVNRQGQSVYAKPGERSPTQREVDGRAALDLVEKVAFAAGKAEAVAQYTTEQIDRAIDAAAGRAAGARWLSEVDASPPPPRLRDRYDPKGLSVVYGPSGVGKGVLLSTDIVELVHMGHRPLIVDYESHADEYARRITAIGGPEVVSKVLVVTPIDREFWKGPSGPLWDVAAALRALVEREDRTVMIVDSLGPACMGMGMNDPETPQRFTEATQRICPLTIAVGQVNRAGDLSSPFGSVFWKYWSRAMWSAERAPGRDRDNLQGILLTDRKANNYARAERLLVNVEWRDNLPIEAQEQPYAMALADQIEAVISLRQLTVAEIVEVLNEEVDEDAHAVKPDSVRKALRRGMNGKPPRFAVEGKGSTAKWSL